MQQTERLRVDGRDMFSLAAELARRLREPPYHVRIADFGTDPRSGRAIARLIANIEPLHPRQPFGKLTFTEIRVDPVAFAGDGDGTRYSRTAVALAPHTDGTHREDPYELVALQMVQPDRSGGETTIVAVPDAVRALSPEAITALREPAFTFAGRQHPILWGSPAEPLMRYYRTQLDEDVAAGAPLAPRHRMAVDELDAVLADLAPRCQFRLEAGEMILINNIRALHGRTALEDDSARLMYRFRVHAGCLYPPN